MYKQHQNLPFFERKAKFGELYCSIASRINTLTFMLTYKSWPKLNV